METAVRELSAVLKISPGYVCFSGGGFSFFYMSLFLKEQYLLHRAKIGHPQLGILCVVLLAFILHLRCGAMEVVQIEVLYCHNKQYFMKISILQIIFKSRFRVLRGLWKD